MKTTHFKIGIVVMIFALLTGCKKGEVSEDTLAEIDATSMSVAVSDTISYAATQEIRDKKFIKTAEVNMEVKDVYNATISIEKKLKNLGGFVTSSNMNSQIISEDTYNTSDTEAMLVRKFQMENSMQVRVPTKNLGEFLQFVSDKKLFLNSRIISAEDVTSNIKFAELEGKRIKKTGDDISPVKNNLKKVDKADEIRSESNYHELASLEMSDQLKYSTINIYIKEPKISVANIAITNTKNIDNQFKMNFFYDMKNAFVDGFYLIQKLIIGLTTIWPLLLIGAIIFYFLRRRKPTIAKEVND